MEVLKSVWNRIESDPAVVMAVIVAAINSTPVGDQSWQGYAAAIVTALLRFVVSPYYGAEGVKAERASSLVEPQAEPVVEPTGIIEPEEPLEPTTVQPKKTPTKKAPAKKKKV
jgi:hypothetical protein